MSEILEKRETPETLAASTRRTAEDFLVGGFGLVASVITAFVLWIIEQKVGLALYTWMIWFVIPAGALISGFAGASGYYFGAWLLGHRPKRLLLLNIVIASLFTFFCIHYLSYMTLQVDGKEVSDYIPFTQYLDIAIRSTSMEFRFRGAVKMGETGALGSAGYAIAVLQVLGFAVGGFCVYAFLVAKPYCDKCSRYLSAKGRQVRYARNAEDLKEATEQLLQRMAEGEVPSAVEQHRNAPGFGTTFVPQDCYLCSVVEVQRCKKCEAHWVKFVVQKKSGDDWKDIRELTYTTFTNQVVKV
jgi:hypothetical protein